MNLEEFEENIKKIINEITDYYDVDVKFEEYEYDKELIVRVYRKYYEISEYCSEVSESEEEFNGCVENTLEEINEESSINLELKYVSNDIIIDAYPLVCDRDYCRVGLEVRIRFYHDVDDDTLIKIIEPVVKIAFSDIILTNRLLEKSFNKILA